MVDYIYDKELEWIGRIASAMNLIVSHLIAKSLSDTITPYGYVFQWDIFFFSAE